MLKGGTAVMNGAFERDCIALAGSACLKRGAAQHLQV
jgi:hypothetical protein